MIKLKTSAPSPNQWGYDVPAVPSCLNTATQTTHHHFTILQRAACLQLDIPLDKCQCTSLAVKTQEAAFYPLQCHSGQLGCYWGGTDKPEISPNLSQANSFMQP